MKRVLKYLLVCFIVCYIFLIIFSALNKLGHLKILSYQIRHVEDGYVVFKTVSDHEEHVPKEGLMTTSGDIIYEPDYDDIWLYDDHIELIKSDDYERLTVKKEETGIKKVMLETSDGDYFFDQSGNKQRIERNWIRINLDAKEFEYGNGNQYYRVHYKFSTDHSAGVYEGLIDATGKTIIEPIYYYVLPFENGLARVRDKRNEYDGYIDKNGEYVLRYESIIESTINDEHFIALENHKWGVVDRDDRTIIEFKYDSLNKGTNTFLIAEQGGHYGLIDAEDNIIVDFNYKNIEKLSYPRYRDSYVRVTNQNDLVGAIDSNGEFIINCMYDEIEAFPNDSDVISDVQFFKIFNDLKQGVVDREGNTIIPPIYDNISYSNKNKVFIYKNGSEWGLLSNNGEVITTQIGDYHTDKYSNYLIPVTRDSKWTFYDYGGKLVTDHKFIVVAKINDEMFNVIRKELGQIKYGILDHQGELIFENDYKITRVTSGYVFITTDHGGLGVMTLGGDEIIDTEKGYDAIHYAGEDKFIMEKDGEIYSLNGTTLEKDKLKDNQLYFDQTSFIIIGVSTSIMLLLVVNHIKIKRKNI